MAAVRRRIVEPLWAGLTGARMLRAWHALERAQYLPPEVLRERQWRRLCSLLLEVQRKNEFYRRRLFEVGISETGIQDYEDFRRIPILTKADVRTQGTGLLSAGCNPDRLMKARTGGSTGVPLELRFTEEVSQLRNASGRCHKRWSGWEVGEPIAAVWGNPAYARTFTARLREWLLGPVIYLDTMSLTPDAVRRFERDWIAAAPTLLFGHAHSVFLLAKLVDELNARSIRPRAIVTSSMMLVPHERALIEQVFGVRVTDMYGCEEVGLIASECERHQGLHVNMEQVLVEVLREDGTPAGPGETGAVIVTDLLNDVMPFVRYRMEDFAEMALQPCSCGRGLPTLSRIVGRTADFLKRADGSRVAGISLIENSLTRIPGIDQMQIVQESLQRIVLRIVPGEAFTAGRRDELVQYFSATFPGALVETEDVNELQRESNGKYRFSICRVPDEPRPLASCAGLEA